MNKQAYEHLVGLAMTKRANLWDDIVSHVKSNKDHYWIALGGGLAGGGLGYAISRKPVGILLGMLLGAGTTGGLSKWLSAPKGTQPTEELKKRFGIGTNNDIKADNDVNVSNASNAAVYAHLKWAINNMASPEKVTPSAYALYESLNPNNVINNYTDKMDRARRWDNKAIEKFKQMQEIPDHTSREAADLRNEAYKYRDWAREDRRWSTDPYWTSYNHYSYNIPKLQAARDRKAMYHINEAKSYSMPPYKNYAAATNR